MDTLNKPPDYAEVFNDNPRAGFSVLVCVALLSALGWSQLPRQSGLRLLISSNLVVSILIKFTRCKRLIQEPPEAIASIVVVLGLLNLILLTEDGDPTASALASFSFISGWSIHIAFPGIQDGLIHALDLTPSSKVSRYAVDGATFPIVLTLTFGSLMWTHSNQYTDGHQVQIQRVATLALFATVLFSLGKFGYLMLAKALASSSTM
jgi:hypothetical protein